MRIRSSHNILHTNVVYDAIMRGGDNCVLTEYTSTSYTNPFTIVQSFDKESHFIIVPNVGLINRQAIEKLLKEYYIREIFDLGNCYLGHMEEPFALWYITKTPVKRIKISVFYKDAHPENDNKGYGKFSLKLPESFTNSYLRYIELLNDWHIGTNSMPMSVKNNYEFIEIDATEFEYERAYAKYYRNENNDIRKLLSNTTIVPIESVADVFHSGLKLPNLEKEQVRIINHRKAPLYPFIYERDSYEWAMTNVKLQKNDIVVYKHPFDCFLLNFELDKELYAFGTVVRATKIHPEYLYLYLKSNTAQKISEELKLPLGILGNTMLFWNSIDLAQNSMPSFIEGFPVVLPQKPDEYYKDLFLKVSTPNSHHYSDDTNLSIDTIEDAINRETIEAIKFHNDTLVRKQVLEDIEELNICFSHGAYKAALILSGSILEAVLLDWLSEIDGINYFEKPVKIKREKRENSRPIFDEDGNPTSEIVETTNLYDYINRIKEIKKPEWMQEAKYAQEIRKKRNLVHAKLCLKEDVKIDDALCARVIEYLKIVLESRGIRS